MTQTSGLVTSRLIIRRFRPADADDLYEYLSDPRVYRFEPGEPLDREQASRRAADMAASPNFWAVELRHAGKVIGQLYLKQIEPAAHLTCELGYILSPAYHGQGYGSEAAAALVGQVLSAGGMHRIVAHCNPENTASWKLLEKVGFSREGLLRQNVFFRRNAVGEPIWTDTYIYARLAAEVDLRLRTEQPTDIPQIRLVDELAFGRPAEAGVVDLLRQNCGEMLSLVAEKDDAVVGHILFTPAIIESAGRRVAGMGLAPLAVLPEHQGRGIGSALVRRGLDILRERNCPFVIVLGHPAYYPRFGFERASLYGLACQWEVPDEAFMVLILEPDALAGVSGVARYRAEFDEAV